MGVGWGCGKRGQRSPSHDYLERRPGGEQNPTGVSGEEGDGGVGHHGGRMLLRNEFQAQEAEILNRTRSDNPGRNTA